MNVWARSLISNLRSVEIDMQQTTTAMHVPSSDDMQSLEKTVSTNKIYKLQDFYTTPVRSIAIVVGGEEHYNKVENGRG